MMDERMIELAKAKRETMEICGANEDCSSCPMCLSGGRCICIDGGALAEAEKMCGADEESHGNPKFTEIMAAKETLETYCESLKDCDGCVFDHNVVCRVGCPPIWGDEYISPKKEAEQTASETEPEPSFTPTEKRKRILDEAIDAVCRDRCEMYGEAEDNFGVIAELWNAYIHAITGHDVDLTPKQVAEMMILFKVGRAATAMEDHLDTYVDIAGYAACAGGMCTDA